MKTGWKRLLALFLTMAMVLSLGAVGYAADDEIVIVDPENETEQPDPVIDGTQLDLEEIDPDTLGIHKLGEETGEEDGIALVGFDGDETASAFDPDEIVRVSIFLDSPATLDVGYSTQGVGTNAAATAYRDSLRAQQRSLTAEIESEIGHTLDVKWNLTLAVNAISANVRAGDIPLIEKIAGVRSVIRENRYEAYEGGAAQPNTANTSSNMVGAVDAWHAGYTGAGSRIAIIDTGIDTTHQSFNADAFDHAIAEVRASGKTVNLMTSIPTSGLNAKNPKSFSTKIPYGYNYIDENQTITHTGDTQGEHGSHVAGIAAANRFIKSGSDYVDAAETVGAVGMAPDAQLLIMKVFGSGGGAYDSDYMAAIEDAIVLDCDAVNLSLGSSSQGWTYSDYQDVMNKLSSADNEGMVVSISAGNAYDLAYMMTSRNLYRGDVSFHTGGSPGTFLNSLCVAAAQNTITTGTPMKFNGSQDVYYYESTGNEEEGTTYTNPKLTTIKGSYSYVYIDAIGSASDYSTINSAVSLSGKIVIVNRGELSFVEKGENAKSYNPKAVIIANNQDGTIYMDLSDFTGTFPMVTITLKDANLIKQGGTAHTANGITYYTGSVQVTDVEQSVVIDRSEATITDFSSWGVPGSLIMKPEITAPGGDIYSVAGTHNTSGGTAGGSDQYEYMSGTSMAAPHITGLAAVVAQYLREKDLASANSALTGSYSTRAIIQSLLMSTATPMKPDGQFLPILQQGAGLVEVNKAVSASSVLVMNEAGLTTLTGAAADGKVKVELGDDPDRSGEYSYSFTLYNITDKDLSFELDTRLFTQATDGVYTLRGTMDLPGGGVSYTWNGAAAAPSEDGHDVNKDGVTDDNDAQAILDYLAEKVAEEDLDLTVADLDEDGDVTTYDAHLLLNWEPEGEAPATGYVLGAKGTAEVTVTIRLTDAQKSFLEEAFPGTGAYLEGYTYVTCTTSTREGVSLAHQHSIPILGFYGNWTDPSMFDAASYVGGLYEDGKISYTGNQDTNYLRLMYGGSTVKFSGNPYMVEEEFPADRLAINSSSTMVNLAYNLVRASAATGFAVSKLDKEHQITEIKTAALTGNNVEGIYYRQSSGSWQNTTMKTYSVNKSAADYGFAEGDRFRVGFYAIPEYYGMLLNETWTQEDSAQISLTGFRSLLTDNRLGSGAFVGYDFVVDNHEPVIDRAQLSGSTITVHATDNENLAYVAVLSLDGTVKYAEAAPGSDEYSITFDASDAIANANGYVAVFAGDYAGNEAAKAIKVNDNTHVEKTVYVLTSTLTAGNDYLIVNTNTAGSGTALGHSGTTVATNAVTIKAGISDTGNQPYIDSVDVAETSVWTASSGIKLMNGNYYLRRNSNTGTTLQASTTNNYNTWTWNGTNNRLSMTISNRSYYLRYNNNTFSLSTATNSVYLFVKTIISTEVDPYTVSGVTVTPSSLDLYKGNTADLVAKVTPITAEDRTVTWSSSNNSIATVDATGHVTAVAAGTATITATANGNTAVKAACTVTVTAVNKQLNAIVWDEEGSVFFSAFNANNLPTWTKNSGAVTLNDEPLYLHNAFMADTSTLYASTLDLSDTSIIYSVNRSTYAVTEYGTNYVPAFGMARVGTSFGTGYFVYPFAKYLIFGNLAPETDDELGTFSGFPYGLLDLTTTNVGDAYAVALCARSISTTSTTYYFLDETGKIWQTSQSYSSTNGITFSSPTLVVDTGLSAGLQYQSLYYDGTNIYWSRQVDNVSELIIYQVSSGKLYHAGNFGEGVWPAAGLYVDGSAAPASVDVDEPMTLDLKPVATRDQLLTRDVCERLGIPYTGTEVDYEIVSMDDETEDLEIVEIESNGTLNAIRGSSAVMSTDSESETDENGRVVITVSEDSVTTNGWITVEYDPDVMTVNEEESSSDLAYHAFRFDDKGVVSFFYANKDELPAGTVLAEVVFTTACGDTEVNIQVWERNDDFELDEYELVPVSGTGHDWGEPTWIWAEDFSTATAKFVCGNVAEHVEEIAAVITSAKTEATCEQPGRTVYTATAEFNGKTYTDTRTVEIPAIGHDWGAPTYTWAADNSSVTAEMVCENDASHKITETVDTTAVTTAATCEAAGKTVYTATFTNEAFETQTKEVEIPATGHDWGEPTWTWAEDHSTATAKFVCGNAAEHVEEIAAVITSAKTEATCEQPGRTVYTATAEFNGKTYTDTRTVEIPATGHSYGAPTYTWAADNSSVTAEAVCTHDASHKITETVNTTYAVITEPTTEAEGLGRYTATFTNEAFETQTKDVVLPKLDVTGYRIHVTDYTKGAAATSLVDGQLYSGEVSFTVSCDAVCRVGLVKADGSIEALTCTTSGETHSFTVIVSDADVELVIVVKGDFDLSGEAKSKDATMIKQYMVGNYTMEEETAAVQTFAGDADGNGSIALKDATLLSQVLVETREFEW